MALPSYQDIYQWLHEQGLEPLPCPDKRPTRKGLGRYLRDCIMYVADEDVLRWQKRWFGCSRAYSVMLNRFGVRLPSMTFWYDKITVEHDLMDPAIDQGEDMATRQQAMRWARSR